MAAQPKVRARPAKWLTPVALVVLREENSYGYELIERLEGFNFEEINPASLYRTLRQMEREGLCKSVWEQHPPAAAKEEESGPANRMYSITDSGEAFLDAWVEACEKYREVMDSLSRAYITTRKPHTTSFRETSFRETSFRETSSEGSSDEEEGS
jgi:PadR family transcriptional regulator PadR